MIIDHRTYTVLPGKLPEFLKAYETLALPLQLKYLEHCMGWYVSNDIGDLNQVVHMWAFKDLNDRAERRAKMVKDPAWGDYAKVGPFLLQSMANKILTPAPFYTPHIQL